MTPDEAFLQAIRESPADDAPRLIYADWLEEHGQADRADFIRAQCRLARSESVGRDSRRLTARAEELLREHWGEWVGPLRELVGPMHDRYGESWLRDGYHSEALTRYCRGFVDRLTLDAERFLSQADTLLRLVPLRELRLWGAGRCAPELADCPRLAGLEVLAFSDYWGDPLTPRDARALASSPYLHGLKALHAGWNSLADEGVTALVRAPWLTSLVLLDLTDNGITDDGTRALADCPYLTRLQTLHLRRNPISGHGRAALEASPHLRRLTRLEVDLA
jgi:uncharacterized protein (TIGR02996 family)